MKTTSLQLTGLAVALVVFGLIALSSSHAQQGTSKSSALAVTTNWVGYLVVGQTDTLDRITPGAPPTTVRQVEIGLRSDGVVVWQEAGQKR